MDSCLNKLNKWLYVYAPNVRKTVGSASCPVLFVTFLASFACCLSRSFISGLTGVCVCVCVCETVATQRARAGG